jgi:hypothetical protein
VAAIILLVGLLWLAPILVAHSPMLSWAVGYLTTGLRGKVHVESASLGWFSPIAMSGIEIRDEHGQPVLEATKVTGERWLSGLLWNSSKLGRFRAEKPKCTLVLRDDGSNLEDILNGWASIAKNEKTNQAADGTAGQATDLQVEIVDGQVLVNEARTQRSWLVQNLQVVLALPADTGKPITFETSGLIGDQRRSGRFEAKLFTGQGGGKADQLELKAQNVPLAVLAPLVARSAPGIRLDGWLSSDLQCQGADLWKLDRVVVQGQAAAEEFVLTAPQLGSDQLRLGRFQANCQLASQESRLQVSRLEVESDVGRLSATGQIDLSGDASTSLVAKLPRQTCEIHGLVDLPRLAAMLPETLRIRRETQVTSGQLQFSLASRPGQEGMTWQGQLSANNLTAQNQGRQLAWQQPILVVLAAREKQGGFIVDSLRCDSDFLKIEGAGTTEDFSAVANLDLNQLVGQLNGLIDFGNVRLAGNGSATLHWRQPPQRDFLAEGQLQVQGLQLVVPDRPAWTEERLMANFSASGRTDFSSNTRLGTLTLDATAGDDRLEARLVQPIPDFRDGGTWPLAVRSTGELARLLPRLSPWFSCDGLQLAGRYDLQTQLIGKSGSLHVSSGKLVVDQLLVNTGSWNLQEPHAELDAEGGYDQTRQRLDLKSARLTSTTLTAQTQGLVLAYPATCPAELAGSIVCQGNLDRLQQWLVNPKQPAEWRLGGQLAGVVELQPSPAGFATRLDASINNLAVAHASGQQFQEPQVRLVGRGNYQRQQGVFVIEQAELVSGTVGATAVGQYLTKDDANQLQADAKVNYDLEKLSALLRSYLGDGIYAAGRGSCPINYQGPLAMAGSRATAAFGWQWANLYGFEVGSGEIQAALTNGTLQMRPLELAVSEGRVRFAPQVRLSDTPMLLSVAPGRVAEQIRINPRMCAHGLQYIAPVMAGVATAEGRFTIELDSCHLPLSEPSHGEFSGRMIIHDVQIGPGPLVQELAIVLGRPYPAQLTRQSVIPFRLVDGRVYHQNLELVFPDVTIRTSGSVGLDQTMAIMAEMPVPPKWIGNNPLGAALKNQTIRLPISGTLSKPAIDRRVLDQLSQQFVRNAAQGVIQDQVIKHQDEIQKGLNKVNRELDRLFGPPPNVK